MVHHLGMSVQRGGHRKEDAGAWGRGPYPSSAVCGHLAVTLELADERVREWIANNALRTDGWHPARRGHSTNGRCVGAEIEEEES